ncbi:MAG: DoxX family membrane protein [Bacteroidota bacterium]
MNTEKKKKYWDYIILCARVLLALTFINYGWAKLSGNQFGVSASEMNMTIKEIGLFKLSWYLFEQQPFKSFIGISQIIAGLLLLYNRTLILGALMFIPILANILVIDMTYIKMPAFYWRLSYYILLDILILWHYKDRMFAAFKSIVAGINTKYKFSWKAYALIPVIVILLECLPIFIKLIWGIIFHTKQTIEQFKSLESVWQNFLNWLNS